ncbi:MAG: hypothetical protein KatS3mg021_2644 [Fimbriimonadales bacterium]|jgi:hypothetical protein|nr:hypothetical protein HRbin14_01595 [bacterium HR14]GIV14362.1 MAG: hypothetical protein KatS3mg021_2644 [Fimbriimonadales bacterium]CUU33697.1 hypothetical protein GXSOP10_1044 [Armatimonadetes bacterium GXS]
MQKGVDAVAIGVIALGLVVLIVLFVLSNNMMPQPLPAPTMPDLNATEQKIENPLQAAAAPATGGPQMGMPGGFGGGPMAPGAPAPPAGGGRGGAIGAEEE